MLYIFLYMSLYFFYLKLLQALQKIPDKNQENANAKPKLIIRCDKKRRSSEISPGQVHVRRKRAAFGDITNVSVE